MPCTCGLKAVSTLKQWLLSDSHITHPYPTAAEQVELMNTTGIDKKQLKNWFTNARRRIWKPLIKKQLQVIFSDSSPLRARPKDGTPPPVRR